MIELRCHGCGRVAETDTPPKEFVCRVCGCVNIVPDLEDSSDEVCGCIPPKGFEWQEPGGIFMNAATGEITVTSAQGTPMSLKEFINTFGFDPVIAMKRMYELGMNGLPGYVNLSTLGKRKMKQ
jgi:hypothetical protein